MGVFIGFSQQIHLTIVAENFLSCIQNCRTYLRCFFLFCDVKKNVHITACVVTFVTCLFHVTLVYKAGTIVVTYELMLLLEKLMNIFYSRKCYLQQTVEG